MKRKNEKKIQNSFKFFSYLVLKTNFLNKIKIAKKKKKKNQIDNSFS